MLPRSRTRAFGLPDACHVDLMPLVAPAALWQHLAPARWPKQRERLTRRLLNRAVRRRLAPCDEFIAMSGIILEAAQYARQHYGARIWLERGSRHILSQAEVLAGRAGSHESDQETIERELAGYQLADRISVPAGHVAESFARCPASRAKLVVNPYGVNLDSFPENGPGHRCPTPTVLFVGSWSYLKGADILTEALRPLSGIRFIHVGPIVDIAFPDEPHFMHVEPVPQHELARFYADADVFAIASRAEGLAMVQVQALAAGLGLVATERTGARDLAWSQMLADRIMEVAIEDAEALRDGIETMLGRMRGELGRAPLPAEDRKALSWSRYGERYHAEIMRGVAD